MAAGVVRRCHSIARAGDCRDRDLWIGLGFVTPSITAIVSEAFPERRAATLNLLNFSWALGAITAPNLILAAIQHFRFQVPGMLLVYAVALVLAAFLIPPSVSALGSR